LQPSGTLKYARDFCGATRVTAGKKDNVPALRDENDADDHGRGC